MGERPFKDHDYLQKKIIIAKMMFVEGALMICMQEANLGVASLKYYIDGAEETVDITFKNGCSKTVSVTGDSLAAIIMDVVRAAM